MRLTIAALTYWVGPHPLRTPPPPAMVHKEEQPTCTPMAPGKYFWPLCKSGCEVRAVPPIHALLMQKCPHIHALFLQNGLQAFGRFVPSAVVKVLIAGSMRIHEDMSKGLLTVLFADIAGFSTITETIATEKMVRSYPTQPLVGYSPSCDMCLWHDREIRHHMLPPGVRPYYTQA